MLYKARLVMLAPEIKNFVILTPPIGLLAIGILVLVGLGTIVGVETILFSEQDKIENINKTNIRNFISQIHLLIYLFLQDFRI